MRIIIIGNSAAGLNALEAFREEDPASSVTVITRESAQPYSKVLLPYYLQGKIVHKNIFIRDEDYYRRLNATCIKEQVVQLLPKQQTILLEDGNNLPYDKLLIATGSSPVKPPIPGLSGEKIYHFWSLKDAVSLLPFFKNGAHVTVLGSGFVSAQAAWAACTRGLKVSIVELMDRIMANVLDESTATLLTTQIKKAGVDLRVGTVTREIEHSSNGKLILHFEDGASLPTDFIIVGTGVRPNVSFTKGTGIKINSGIVVNKHMETNLPGIYAAGDVAQVPSTFGGSNVVHALWPTAVETGRIAGSCMAGDQKSYQGSLNMNVTRMFNTTVASMGEFGAAEGYESWMDKDLPEGHSLRIVLKNGAPVGASCIGSSELISTLGMLRPLIRGKVSIEGKPWMLKAMIAKNIAQYQRLSGREYWHKQG